MYSNRVSKPTRLAHYLIIASVFAVTMVTQGCTRESYQAEAALEQYLKERGVKEVNVDMFTKDPNRDKAYISATLTHNFATADGKPQKEHRGYILAKTEGKWVVESTQKYTREAETAMRYLAGLK